MAQLPAQPVKTGPPAYPLDKSFNLSGLRDAQGSGSGAIPEHLPSNTGAVPSGHGVFEGHSHGWPAPTPWTVGRNLPERSLPRAVARRLGAGMASDILVRCRIHP